MIRSPIRGLRAPVKLLALALFLFAVWRILPVVLPTAPLPSSLLIRSAQSDPLAAQFDLARERSSWSAGHGVDEDADAAADGSDLGARQAGGRRPPLGVANARGVGYAEEGGSDKWAVRGGAPPQRGVPPPRPAGQTYEEELRVAEARREQQREQAREKLKAWDARVAAAQEEAQVALKEGRYGGRRENAEYEDEEDAVVPGEGGRMVKRPKGAKKKRPDEDDDDLDSVQKGMGIGRAPARKPLPGAGTRKKSPLIQVGGAGKAAGVPGAGGGAEKVIAAAKGGKAKGWDQRFHKAQEAPADMEKEKEKDEAAGHADEESTTTSDDIPESGPAAPALLEHHLVRRLAAYDFTTSLDRSATSALVLDPSLEDSFQARKKPETMPNEPKQPQRYNVTLCSLVPNEQRFLSEWLLYHRLLGVERFALYDTSHRGAFGAAELDALADKMEKEGGGDVGPTAEELKSQVGTTSGPDGLDEKGVIREERIDGLERWIDQGIVELHWMKFDDSKSASNFLENMLEHCTATYGPSTEWLGTLDVDEFLSVSPQLYGTDAPYSPPPPSTADEPSSASALQYPLHDILASDHLAEAACIPLPELSFRNLGVRELKKGQGVLETQTHRDVLKQGKKVMREEGLQQKTLIHTAYSSSPVVSFVGPHSCEVKGSFESAGVSQQIMNSQGGSLQDGGKYEVAKLPIEPLSIAHYLQRDLTDCLSKVGSLSDPNDIHAKSRGEVYCEKGYLPSSEELTRLSRLNDEANRFLLATPAEGSVIEDRRMKDSWAARAAVEVVKVWGKKAKGGGRAAVGVPREVIERAKKKVEVLTF
ncbi:hypothetical protein JCM8547_001175 [Rhodosporidiobolus lusitaniae]